MTSDDDVSSDDLEGEFQSGPTWDPLELMKERARAARSERDESIRNLRDSASDDEIREDFGIDLREIEG